MRRALAAACALAFACASYPVNPALDRVDRGAGYRFDNLGKNPGNSDDTFVILTLSGGGTRAAALAYGAIEALSETPLGGGATLLDEVDVISSVSGGSFAAGYYGSFGQEAFLAEFPQDVLHRKIERDLVLHLLAPWNWWRLASWKYGRSDLVDHYYDRHLFDRRRFGELPRERPFIQLNATDITLGARLSFIQDDFDRLCSDLGGVSVSRGVTASSAFPVGFTPLTLRNWPKERCGYTTPIWVKNALESDLERNPVRYDRALRHRSYENPERRFVHLSDGGIADNIGLRGPLLGLTTPAAAIPIIRMMNQEKIRRVVLVIVDAKPGFSIAADESPRPPGIAAVLNASASNPIENYSADTVELARQYVEEWARQFADAGEESPIAFYRIYVRFEAERNPEVRRRLERIGTRLQLPREEVDRVVAAGARLLRQSPGYRCLVRAIGAEGAAVDAPAGCPEPEE